jgi:hypothetical protein
MAHHSQNRIRAAVCEQVKEVQAESTYLRPSVFSIAFSSPSFLGILLLHVLDNINL